MPRSLLVAGLLVVVGCQGTTGPVQRREQPPTRIDDPRLTIPEQEQRGRDQLALPERSPDIGPRTYADNPNRRGI